MTAMPEPLFLPDVQAAGERGQFAPLFARLRGAGLAVPQIFYLLGFKPAMTEHLTRFTQEVMRGPSPLSPGLRELIAAFTSARNQCLF